ncbi:MAG: hypothetical protein IKU80_03640 [Firmicutes bacterium]|nr:hypothetical protein [Bacillota bacterium]
MTKHIPPTIPLLLKEFTSEYCTLRDSLAAEEKENLLYYSSQLFSKWYFSALINDTYLSPANITECIMTAAHGEGYFTVGISHASNDDAFDFNVYCDNAENSTFINDLKTLCNHCKPMGKLFPKKQQWYNDAASLRKELCFDDPYYISYLMDMACHLGLLSTMPAIGTVVYQYNESKGNEFFSKPVTESMKDVFEASLVIFRNNAMDELMLPPEAISISALRTLITENHVSDDIISAILANLDIDYKEAAEAALKDELNEEDEALVASVVFLSSALGKWLFTPLGTYMRILKPLHCVAVNFNSEIDYIRPFMHLDFDLTCELFSCCNFYGFTSFGKAVLNPPQDDYSEDMEETDFDEAKLTEILETANYYRSVQEKALEIFKKHNRIYRFRISYASDEDMWKIIEIDVHSTLAQFAKAIDSYFGIFDNENYIFKIDGKEYVALSNKRSFSKAENTVVNETDITTASSVVYCNPHRKDDDMIIEFICEENASIHSVYPRLLKQSKEITASEKS